MTFLEDTHFSTLASLSCARSNTASAVDLLFSWKLYVSTFSATCSCHVEKDNTSFLLLPRESREQPTPQHNASAPQHISTSAQSAQTTATNNTATNTTRTTIYDQQQMHSHKTPATTHEDHIAGKGYNSMTHHNLVRKFIPVPHAMKIPDAKAAVDKEWKKLETTPAWQLGKSQKQEGGYSGSTMRPKESPIFHIDGHLSSQKCGVRTIVSKV